MPSLKVFEYQTVRAGDELMFYHNGKGEKGILEEKYITALWKMYDEQARPFFTPTRGGIRFCEWVGVIRVLDLTLEILPKADNNENYLEEAEQSKWQSILIDMLRICRALDTPTASDAPLRLKSNSILDLYIERFIQEVNFLLHTGLIKRYKKIEGNSTALKGKLLLQKHFTKNLVHQERFYVEKTSYDQNHLIHQILYKAIKTLPRICNNQYLVSRCYQLLLNFPEVSEIKIDATLFDKLGLDRKSAHYRSAVAIAKLILLNLRPDISSGAGSSIAILFDMNKLWEEYIYRMLQKANDGTLKIYGQRSTGFWKHLHTSRSLKPDIIIEKTGPDGSKGYTVLDTKWKNLHGQLKNVGMDDLRQMFAYHHYFDAVKCYLLYPGEDYIQDGNFHRQSHFDKRDLGSKSCGVIISKAWKAETAKSYLNKEIGKQILSALRLDVCSQADTAVHQDSEAHQNFQI
ncbi:McrC family protein [Pedobacter sp. BMA]|uniref:McrC family protein n=1 Tax=Pedobacter sp. BMA TaxID=1663685 RepID=UPI00069DF59C|nr:hypothetical protein [Pedobacter sp. BMA]